MADTKCKTLPENTELPKKGPYMTYVSFNEGDGNGNNWWSDIVIPEQHQMTPVQIMAAFHSSDAELVEESKLQMIFCIQQFIKQQINRRISSYVKNNQRVFLEVFEECVLEILDKMKDYNPQYAPTTYFYFHIARAISSYVETEIFKTSAHYTEQNIRVRRAISKLESQGKTADPLSISITTGLDLETVNNALVRLDIASAKPLEEIENAEEILASHAKSPERLYLEKETIEALNKGIDTLPPKMREMFIRHFDDGDERAFAEVAKEMRMPSAKVASGIAAARRHLSENNDIRNLFPDRNVHAQPGIAALPEVIDDMDSVVDDSEPRTSKAPRTRTKSANRVCGKAPGLVLEW